jgi:hypothetical protein
MNIFKIYYYIIKHIIKLITTFFRAISYEPWLLHYQSGTTRHARSRKRKINVSHPRFAYAHYQCITDYTFLLINKFVKMCVAKNKNPQNMYEQTNEKT